MRKLVQSSCCFLQRNNIVYCLAGEDIVAIKVIFTSTVFSTGSVSCQNLKSCYISTHPKVEYVQRDYTKCIMHYIRDFTCFCTLQLCRFFCHLKRFSRYKTAIAVEHKISLSFLYKKMKRTFKLCTNIDIINKVLKYRYVRDIL